MDFAISEAISKQNNYKNIGYQTKLENLAVFSYPNSTLVYYW